MNKHRYLFLIIGLSLLVGILCASRLHRTSYKEMLLNKVSFLADDFDTDFPIGTFVPTTKGEEKILANRETQGCLVLDAEDVENYQEGFMYVVICAGTKSTGGHQLLLTSVKEENAMVVITAQDIAPPKDAIVTMAITYPTIYLRIQTELEWLKCDIQKSE